MTNNFGEMIFTESDLCDAILRGHSIEPGMIFTVDNTVDLEILQSALPDQTFIWQYATDSEMSLDEFDQQRQKNWFMPDTYKQIDIAQHVLNLCNDSSELQRAGQELLMFQERGLFDLLRYLMYLVDVMREHNIVWGVGRGSSVASFVLYKLGVHKINSLYYDLDPKQFLR